MLHIFHSLLELFLRQPNGHGGSRARAGTTVGMTRRVPPSIPPAACPPADISPAGRPRRGLAVWLAGTLSYDAYAAMAERLAWDVSEPSGRPPTLLLYELQPEITIGRLGSRCDVELTDEELQNHRLNVRFVGRGGGAVLHAPGQIGVALFAKLEDLGLLPSAVGPYLDRFEAALEGAIRSLRCGAARDSRLPGIFGRTGLLAAVGIAVRRGVVSHGAFVNVSPALDLFHRVRSVGGAGVPRRAAGPPRSLLTMGSIEADVQRRVRVQDARAALVEHVVEAFAFPSSHIQSGFPLPLRAPADHPPEFTRRVG